MKSGDSCKCFSCLQQVMTAHSKYVNVLNLRGYYMVTAVHVWCYITQSQFYQRRRTYDELEAAAAQLSSGDSLVEQQSNEPVLDETVCEATSTVCQHECQQDEECWHYEGRQHGWEACSTSAHFEASVQERLTRPHVGQSHSLEHELRTAEAWQETLLVKLLTSSCRTIYRTLRSVCIKYGVICFSNARYVCRQHIFVFVAATFGVCELKYSN